ncbi:hypothetical protein D3C84_891600 [compost metagenome]
MCYACRMRHYCGMPQHLCPKALKQLRHRFGRLLRTSRLLLQRRQKRFRRGSAVWLRRGGKLPDQHICCRIDHAPVSVLACQIRPKEQAAEQLPSRSRALFQCLLLYACRRHARTSSFTPLHASSAARTASWNRDATSSACSGVIISGGRNRTTLPCRPPSSKMIPRAKHAC